MVDRQSVATPKVDHGERLYLLVALVLLNNLLPKPSLEFAHVEQSAVRWFVHKSAAVGLYPG